MAAYLGAYAKEYSRSAKQSHQAWTRERRQRIVGKSSISVTLDDLSVTVDANKAIAKFRQEYKGDALAVSSRKTLNLVKTGDRWLIVRESAGN